MADNFHIDITSGSKEHFDMAMNIAFSNCPGKKAYRYSIDDQYGLVLYWATDSISDSGLNKSHPLPYPMAVEEAINFVWGWLKSAPYGEEPDHDGSNKKGWRVYNESWGHAGGSHYGFVAIQPEWLMYGK